MHASAARAIDRMADSNAPVSSGATPFPVTGHTLIIPRRHVRSFFELDSDERVQLLEVGMALRVVSQRAA